MVRRRKESGKFVTKKGGGVPRTVGREEAGVPAYETETDRLTGPADGNSRADSRR